MLGQAMPPRLERHRVANDLLNPCLSGAGAQLGAQIDLVIAQQAQMQPAVGGQAHAVACRAERVADRADETKLALRTWNAEAAGRVGWCEAKRFKWAVNGL